MLRRIAPVLIVCMLVTAGTIDLAPVDAASRGAPSALPPLDQYGGAMVSTLGATGFFRIQTVGSRWWMVTPDGHPFYSAGLNHVTPIGTVDKNGHAAYAETVMSKYGSHEAWATAQVPRFEGWGVNTLGGWSTLGLFAGKGIPYTILFGFAGQDFGTGNMSDFWEPGWVAGVQSSAAATAGAYKDDPWLVGYFLDNELHFTRDWRLWDQLDLYLKRSATSAGKQHLVAWLNQRYGGDFAAFAADFAPTATDWTSLEGPTDIVDTGPGAVATREAWAGEVAERYFSVTDDALQTADPNHLNLGARFLTQLTTPEIAAAAGRHVDVISVNWYDIKPEWADAMSKLGPPYLPTADTLRSWYTLTGKPMLVSEFGYRAMDSGLPNTWPPFQVVVDTQEQRAAGFINYVDCALNTGYFVGSHWFEMTDEPAIGRSDGEDDNWGMVTEGDDEYPLVTAASATLLDHAYTPLTDPESSPFPCQAVGPQPPPSTSTTTSMPSTSAPATSVQATSSTAGSGSSAGSGRSASSAITTVATPRFTG